MNILAEAAKQIPDSIPIPIDQLISLVGAQLVIIASTILPFYFSLKRGTKSALKQGVQEVKNHTDASVSKLNGMLSSVIHSFDRPAWIKKAVRNRDTQEIEFRMLELNHLYSKNFSIDREEYIGKTDLEAGWGHKEAEIFRKNDLLVWATGEPQTVVEDLNGQTYFFRKLRVQSHDGTLKGVMGYIVEDAKGLKIDYRKTQEVILPEKEK